MANFGPPGGGAPDPWDGRPGDRYAPPAGQRPEPGYPAQPGGWGEPPGQRYEPVGYPYQAPAQYEPSAGWNAGQPHPPAEPGYAGYGGQSHLEPPPKRGKGRLVAVLAVALVLVLGGAATFWVLTRDEPAPVSGSGAPAADPSAAASAPAPASSTDPRFVQAGQCVRNDGNAGQPELLISECGPKTYQVLRRIDGKTSGEKDAEAKCAKVAGYTDWYFFDSELDSLDFVLCLKQR